MKRAEGLLTRAELAKAIGKSKTTVRRWEAKGKITPIVDEHGVHLFRVEDAQRLNGGEPIATLPRARAYVASADRANSELGAQVFDLLLQRVPRVKIVTQLRIHPNVLEGFLEAWARLRHGFFVDGRQLRAIARLLRVLPETADDLVKVLARQQAHRERCRACHREPPVWCYPCVSNRVDEVLKDHGVDRSRSHSRSSRARDDEADHDDDEDADPQRTSTRRGSSSRAE